MVLFCNTTTGELYKVHCPRLNYMAGHYESEHMDDENTVTTTCLRNFHYVSGDYVRSCLVNGSWTGKDLVCEVDYFMERFKLSGFIVASTFLLSLIFFGVDFWFFARRRHNVRKTAQRRLYTVLQTQDGVIIDVSELKDLSRRARRSAQPRTHLHIPLVSSTYRQNGHGLENKQCDETTPVDLQLAWSPVQTSLTFRSMIPANGSKKEDVGLATGAHDEDKKKKRLPIEFEDWWLHKLQQKADTEEFFGVNLGERKRRSVKPKKQATKKRKRGIFPVMHFEVTPDQSTEFIQA